MYIVINIFIILIMLLISIKSFILNIDNRNVLFKYNNNNIRSIISTNMKGDKKQDEKKKTYTKSNLPSKICIVCNRPYEYRKK